MSRKLRPGNVGTPDASNYREMFIVSADDPGSTLPAGLPDRTVGWDVLAWIEATLRNPETGDPWRLTREQVRFLLWWYAYDATLRPLFTRGELVRMKGAGKSPFAAVLTLVEACGPCRPGPNGTAIPATAPYIPVSGVSEDNAESTMEFVRRIAKNSPVPIDVGLGRLVTPDGGLIEPVTASAWTMEGRRPTFAPAEETQHWTETNRGRELYRVLLRNCAKSPDGWARVLGVTNRHLPGSESVAEVMWEAHQAGLPGVLYDCREGPAEVDLTDRAEVIRAVKIAAGDSWWVPVERIADEAVLTDPATWMRYYANRITHAEDAWLDAAEYDRCVTTREITTTEPIVMAFDGSIGRTTAGATADSTVLVGCTLDGMHVFPIACWSQPPGAKEWTVPVDQVVEVLRSWMRIYNVVAFAADPAHWEGVVAQWEQDYGPKMMVKAGATPIAYRMNRPGIVARDTEALHSGIVGGAVTLDSAPVLRSHFLNARRKPGTSGVQLRKEHPSSDRKIDLAVASVLAHAVALEARRAGADRPKPIVHAPYRIL